MVGEPHDAAVVEEGGIFCVGAEIRRHLGGRGEALVAGDVVGGVAAAEAEPVDHVGDVAMGYRGEARAGCEGGVVVEVGRGFLDVVLVDAVVLVLGFAADCGVGDVAGSQRWQEGGEEGEGDGEAPC